MIGENLQLTLNNFVRVDGYFYNINPATDVLYKKTDDGTNAFSYPLDVNIVGPITCLQHDGRYFWTLENNDPNIVIKKWEVDEYVLKQKQVFNIQGSTVQKYGANAFAVEHYHKSLSGTGTSGTTLVGSSSINLNNIDRVETGDLLNFGPSNHAGFIGKVEERTVSGVISGTQTVVLTTPLVNSYALSDAVCFSKRCWIFNKYQFNDTVGSGGLYSFDLTQNGQNIQVISRLNGNQYKTVTAASFLTEPRDSKDYLVYMSQTNLLFIDTNPNSSNFLSTVKSASQNNQLLDSTVISIYAVTHEGSTLFRLQNKASIYVNGTLTDVDWGARFNYQLSPLNRFPASIGLTADPSVLSADGVSQSSIKAIVRDQFDDTVGARLVSFTDTDTVGIVNPTQQYTNSQGEADTVFTAGTTANLVKITAQT